MKSLLLTAVLPLFACAAIGQDKPPATNTPAETVKKAHPAAWLGITMSDSDGKVVIGQIVPGSPAAKAGLQFRDVLVRIGDAAVEGEVQRVLEKIGKQNPGDAIELQLQRGDKDMVIRVELAERPAELDGDFRGEFRKELVKPGGIPGEMVDGRHKTLKETNRDIERVKEDMKREAGELRREYKKMENKHKLMGDIGKSAEEGKKKLESGVELDPYKKPGDPDLFMELPRLDAEPGDAGTEKLLRYYLDRGWSSDKAEGKQDEWKPRLGFELPLFKWAEQNRKAAGKQQKPGDGFNPLLRFTIPHSIQEAAIWKRVQDSIARALNESDIGPDLSGKVMKAVEEARRAGSEKDARRTKLEAEAAKLEKEMQSLRERSDKLREELKKAAE